MYVSVDVITHECIVIIGDVMMSGCMANCTGVDIAMIVCTVTVIGSVYHGFNVTQHEMYDPPLAASRWRVDPGINVVVDPIPDTPRPSYSIEPTPGLTVILST